MKKVALISVLILIAGLYSCEKKTEINCKYQGGIILEASAMGTIMRTRYTIKYEGKIYYAYPFQIDNNYKAGDTINKPCP